MLPTLPADTIVANGTDLTIDDLMAVARGHAPVRLSLSPDAERRFEKSRALVAAMVAAGQPIYGVTTRFGGMATTVLDPEAVRELQANAMWLHKTGVGRALDGRDVRGGMLLRINALARGVSGVRLEIIRRLELFLNRNVTPVVHEFGSIGASGDLVPLTYIAGAITGSDAGFEVEYEGRITDARVVLGELGLEPLPMEPKEGLALINGTSMSAAIAASCVHDARRLVAVTLGIHALMIQALGASAEPFAEFIHLQKPHPGQIWTAAQMRDLLDGSRLAHAAGGEAVGPTGGGLIQDRYSVRCLPQFLGPIVEGLREAARSVEVEMNSASDNPLIEAETGRCYYGGNFLAQVPAVAMDHLRQYVGLMAKHLDAQIALLMEPAFSNGLPGSLVGNPRRAVNMGLKGMQLTANSMMPLLTFLGNTFVDRFPTHAEQFNQNVSSQAYVAGQLARESLRVFQQYLAIALLIATQAVDLRSFASAGSYDPRPLLSAPTRRLYEAVRGLVGRAASADRPYVHDDNEQRLDQHIAAVARDIDEGGRIDEVFGRNARP